VGTAHLVSPWMLEAHDSILAVDIGGTNIRAGIVRLLLDGAPDLSKAKVWKFELWRHGDEKLSRDEAVDGIVKMLRRLINRAKKDGRKLAPFIGIGCPGKIDTDGSIEAGGQNLPSADSYSFPFCDVVPPAIKREHSDGFLHGTAILALARPRELR
jgi:hypothetical protein